MQGCWISNSPLKTNPCFSTLYKSNQPYWDLKWRRMEKALDMVLVARTVQANPRDKARDTLSYTSCLSFVAWRRQ
jgi:hypothetical protein